MFVPTRCPFDKARAASLNRPTVKKVPHTLYATKNTEYCLPNRSFLKTLLCQGDDALGCSTVRVKNQLVKKIVTDEKCELKCLPKSATCDVPCATAVPIIVR